MHIHEVSSSHDVTVAHKSNMASKIVSLQESFTKFFKAFTRIGSIQPTLIALLCWVIVIIGSWIHDFHRPPNFYMSDRRNFFNLVFAKWSLAWTLGFVTPLMVLIYWMKSKANLKVVCKHVLRLVVAVAVWYVVVFILGWIEHLTGDCEGTDLYERKEECQNEGLVWNGFDISGHSFLLSYCALIISEEIHAVQFWRKETMYSKKNNSLSESMSSSEMIVSKELLRTLESVRANEKFQSELNKKPEGVRYLCITWYTICCILMLMWMTLLAFTSVYFHTVNSKVLGIILGLSAWFLTYQVYFSSKYFPGYATGF